MATETEEKAFTVNEACVRIIIAGVIYAVARIAVEAILPGFWMMAGISLALVAVGLLLMRTKFGTLLLQIAFVLALYLLFKGIIDFVVAAVVIIAIVVLLMRFIERP